MQLLIPALVLSFSLGASVEGQELHPKRPYPPFGLGVTGIIVSIEPGFIVTVQGTLPDSPALGLLQKGDVILQAGGVNVSGSDPRVVLGTALGVAEALGGRFLLRIRRKGRERTVSVKIPVLGPYSRTWPKDCPKSKKIIKDTAEFIANSQGKDGAYTLEKRPERDGLSACLAGLFLLSTGNDRYLPHVRAQARGLAVKVEERPTGSTWHLGYQGILLSEYYLRTGDKTVLPGLKALCDKAVSMQAAGAWGHGANMNPGYVQSGQINSAGVPILTTFILARECGVEFDTEALIRSLKFFYRMAGHGCVCYGDHRSELFPNTNGRNAMLACALSLLDDPPFQKAAGHLAMLVADSYYAPEFGHTGGGFNVMWRGLGSIHLPANRMSRYRRQFDVLAWYYDLARLPGGGLSMLPSPPSTTRYTGATWGTGAVALTYTAPLRTLRITGALRTKWSVKAPLPKFRWGTAADLAFLGTDDCEGYGKEETDPEEIHALLRGRNTSKATTDFCRKQMRHQSPLVRTWAARVLAERADTESVEALAEAAIHSDPRVRRAAFDGVSGYDNWGRATAPNRYRGKVSPSVVSERFLPAIEKTLGDPKSAWWELDGALWALGRAEPSDIRKNMALIRKFSAHDEWYLREASYWAIVGLHGTITGREFELLADIYSKERHVFARSSFDAGIAHLLRGDKVALDPGSESRIVQKLARNLHSAPIAHGYGASGTHEAAHRTMMILKHFNPRIWKFIVPDTVRYLSTWTPDFQHSAWLITGSKWQPGFVKVAEQLGPEGIELRKSFEACLKRTPWNPRNRGHQECRKALEVAVGR